MGRMHCVCAVMTSSSRVTAAVRAYRPPEFVTPELAVIEVKAKMFPAKAVPVPRVAELPTCQNTLHAWALLIKDTAASVEVISVDPI